MLKEEITRCKTKKIQRGSRKYSEVIIYKKKQRISSTNLCIMFAQAQEIKRLENITGGQKRVQLQKYYQVCIMWKVVILNIVKHALQLIEEMFRTIWSVLYCFRLDV